MALPVAPAPQHPKSRYGAGGAGPGFLDPNAFYATQAGHKPGASYDNYVGWVTKTRAQRGRARAQGLGLTQPQMNQWDFLAKQMGGAPAGYNQLSDADLQKQAAADVAAIVDPQLKQIQDTYANTRKTGLDSIYGYGQAAAKDLSAIPGMVGGAYDEANAGTAGATDALTAFLNSQGKQSSSDLTDALAGSLTPEATAATTGAGAAMDAGTAAGLAGSGFADLAAGLKDKAAAVTGASKLPGIADLATMQNARGFMSQQDAQLASELGSITSQVPGLTRQTLGDYRDRNLTAAQAEEAHKQAMAQLAASFFGGTLDRASQEKIAQAGLGLDTSKANEQTRQFNVSEADANKNAAADRALTKSQNHQTALGNRSDAIDAARTSVAQMAEQLTSGQIVQQQEPVVAQNAKKKGWYVAKGGDPILGPFTKDPNQAETKLVKSAKSGLTYKQIYQRAWSLYAPALKARYALNDQQVQQIINEGLAAAGVSPGSAGSSSGGPH